MDTCTRFGASSRMIMPAAVDLPPAIAPDLLADACREIAVDARVQPFVVEKDYYLTRLIWGSRPAGF